MEIVHVIRQYKPSVGGLEDASHNLCLALAAIPGNTVRVVTLNRVFAHPDAILPEHEVIDGIKVTRIPFFGSNRYPIATEALKAIKGADVVHVHAVDFFFDFLSIFRFAHRIPLIASTHGGFFHTQFAAKLKRIYFNTVTRFACKGYKVVCASSENDAKTFRPITAGNLVTIENGVNITKWRDAGSKTPVRSLIYIGRWSTNKQIPLLVRFASELRKINTDWRVIISGLPADETVESLTRMSSELGVSENVQIVANPSEDDIQKLIGTASFITSASAYEGFGISVIEGLSAGLFPVVTPLPPFMRLLNALGEGVAIDAADLAKTARETEAAFSNLAPASRAASMKLSENYAWDGIARKFMEVYKIAVA